MVERTREISRSRIRSFAHHKSQRSLSAERHSEKNVSRAEVTPARSPRANGIFLAITCSLRAPLIINAISRSFPTMHAKNCISVSFFFLFGTIFFGLLRPPFHSVIFTREKELIETRTMAENAATTILSLETVRYFATSS